MSKKFFKRISIVFIVLIIFGYNFNNKPIELLETADLEVEKNLENKEDINVKPDIKPDKKDINDRRFEKKIEKVKNRNNTNNTNVETKSRYKVRNNEDLVKLLNNKLDVRPENRPDGLEMEYDEAVDISVDAINDIINSGSYTLTSVNNYNLEKVKYPSGVNVAKLSFKYIETLEDEKYIDEEIDRILNNIILAEMTEYERVEAVNKFIINNTTYQSDDEKDGQSAKILLRDGTGVCAAYARVASRMLDKLEIANYYVAGEGNPEGVEWESHAWNKVRVDGNWYNLDTTWNHPMEEYGDYYEYAYFLKSDKIFGRDHIQKSDNLPEAISEKYDNLYDLY